MKLIVHFLNHIPVVRQKGYTPNLITFKINVDILNSILTASY